MQITDITANCSRCINSEWMSAKNGKPKPYLRCHKCRKDVREGEFCGLFKPSQVVQDYFAGRLKDGDAKIIGAILFERQRAGRL